MKTFILAAALTVSGVAFAQTEEPANADTMAEQPADPSMADPSMSTTPPMADPSMADPSMSTMPPPTDPAMMPPATDPSMSSTMSPPAGDMSTGAGMAVAPGNQAPERDARGIAVVSDSAEAPAGANGPPPAGAAVPSPNQAAVFASRPASEEYQACSRTVTDNCVQNYERGRSPN